MPNTTLIQTKHITDLHMRIQKMWRVFKISKHEKKMRSKVNDTRVRYSIAHNLRIKVETT